MQAFAHNDQIVFLAVQTVFEGYDFNTEAKLRKNQLKYNLEIPMAHAPGNPQTREIPEIIKRYRTGGTPWTVIIEPTGKIVFNAFHINVDEAVTLIEGLSLNTQ